MNQFLTWVKAHPKPVAGGTAAALVAIYALYRRKAAASSGTSANTVAATGTNPGTAGTSAVAGLSGTPDTETSDIENWVQDQLNSLETGQPASTATVPAVTPAATPPIGFTLGNLKVVRNDATGGISQVESDGSLVSLTPAQFAELGNPVKSEIHYNQPPAKAPAAK